MVGSDFAALRAFGSTVAVVSDADGAEITYRALADRAEAFAATLGGERRLILLEAENRIEAVVAYLGALWGGHVLILTGPDGGASDSRLMQSFTPDVIWRHDHLEWQADRRPLELHPDLSLLLPTSGSTGSPKLVRLARSALVANAAAIADYLAINPDDRAITSLPFHYSFGMSVLNSHLHVGASLVLTDRSLTDERFWALLRDHRATSLAGVPYSYELLEKIGFRDNCPESLKVLTQAGGRLSPELVKTYAEFARGRGMRFYAMYGQTEAAPRMAYLPPDLAAQNPDCIGVAIPGGELALRGEDGQVITAPGAEGELVYRGPNVMMGYALSPADLAKGSEHSALRTGDLARRKANGLYQIVGRASRFVKIAGLRIGLEDVEAMVAQTGRVVHAAGADERLSLCVTCKDDEAAAAVREFVAAKCGLPVSSVSAYAAPEPPRLLSGKIDYPAIRAEADHRARAEEARLASQAGPITGAFCRALGIDPPGPQATFTALGGDSLSYINATIGIERALGHLPAGWEGMTLQSLEAMVPLATPPSRWTTIRTEIVIRVLAIASVVVVHIDPKQYLHGGSLILLAFGGYSMARFQRQHLVRGELRPVIAGSLYRLVLPYFVIFGLLFPFTDAPRSMSWVFLTSAYFVGSAGPFGPYWFVSTLFHAQLVACALFLIPPFRRLAIARPFVWALAWLIGALALRAVLPQHWPPGGIDGALTVEKLLYLFVLGWAAYTANGTWRKLIVLLVAAAVTTLDYGVASRSVFFSIALAAILFFPFMKVPRILAGPLMSIAAASYFIYLTHIIPMQLFDYVEPFKDFPLSFKITAALFASLVLGLAYERIWNTFTPWLRRVVRGLRTLRIRPA